MNRDLRSILNESKYLNAESLSRLDEVQDDRLSTVSRTSRLGRLSPSKIENPEDLDSRSRLSKSVYLDKRQLDLLKSGERTRGETTESRVGTQHSVNRLVFQNEQKLSEQLRLKLGYEWRAIYRLLKQQDTQSSGIVDKKVFERVLHEQKAVYLQREDFAYLYRRFPGESPHEVDYFRMSVELNLHMKLSINPFNTQPPRVRSSLDHIPQMSTPVKQQIHFASVFKKSVVPRLMNDAEVAQIVQGRLEQIKQALKQADENR